LQNYFEALLVCNNVTGSSVYLTQDFGTTWSVITGNLMNISGTRNVLNTRSSFILNLPDGERAYLVGTAKGIFLSFSTSPSVWQRLGTLDEFPLVIITQIRYLPSQDVLVASTVGRGLWSIFNITQIVNQLRFVNCPAYIPLIRPFARQSIDCVLSDWTAPAPCSASCGGGLSTQQRSILTPPANGGRQCTGLEPRYSLCNATACSGLLNTICFVGIVCFELL
jgi:hypothetical protein